MPSPILKCPSRNLGMQLGVMAGNADRVPYVPMGLSGFAESPTATFERPTAAYYDTATPVGPGLEAAK